MLFKAIIGLRHIYSCSIRCRI